jgi:CBS domain containing-hemolysin-like protein
LSGAQVGITATTLVVGYLVEPSLSGLLLGPLGRLGIPDPERKDVALSLALVLATVFSMVVGELVPKNLALAQPLRIARVVAPALRAFTVAVSPLLTLLDGTARKLLLAIGVESRDELPGGRSPRELAALVRRSAEVGTLPEGTASLLTRSLGLPDLAAADVMTPRTRLHTVSRSDSAEDLLRRARNSEHSRFPVVGEDLDDVLGAVHVKAAITVPRDKRALVSVVDLMTVPARVPETMHLDRLLAVLRAPGLQLAVVLDEYGGTAGVVTLEDVVEELVGAVSDEHGRAREGIVPRLDGSWLVPGLSRPDEVHGGTGMEIPENSSYDTIAGLVMGRLGRIPAPGDEVTIPGALLRVTRMDRRRVDQVRIIPLAPPPSDGADPRNGDSRNGDSRNADRHGEDLDGSTGKTRPR